VRYTPELHALTFIATATALMWIPYTIARTMTQGMMKTFANPEAGFPGDPPWAQRARRAHANAIENLTVLPRSS